MPAATAACIAPTLKTGDIEAQSGFMIGHEEVRFGYSPNTNVVVVGTHGWAFGLRAGGFEQLWSLFLPDGGWDICSVASTGNVAYVGTHGEVYQLEASSDKQLY